jgi:hypothetical protein
MNTLLKGQEYLLMIVFVFMAVGLIKDNQLFNSFFYYIKQVVRSNRALIAILSAVGGLLPISGRVTVSAGMLDTVAPKRGQAGREHYGVVDYLSTHHYYLWSPLEATVLVPMAAFGITWLAFMQIMWPLLVTTITLIILYIVYVVKETDVIVTPITDFTVKISEIVRNVVPMIAAIAATIKGVDVAWAFGLLTLYYCLITRTWDVRKLLSYVNWEVIIIVAIIIAFGNYVKGYEKEITAFIKTSSFNLETVEGIFLVSCIALGSSLLLGSSGRFVAMAVLLTQLYGQQYFLWFFALEYAGYLLSPAHKCVAVGKSYFGTPLTKYYKILSLWAVLIIITGAFITFA